MQVNYMQVNYKDGKVKYLTPIQETNIKPL